MSFQLENFVPLAIALGLGLLVGMQREWVQSSVGGIRTFALFTLLGTVCAMLADTWGGWILSAGLLGVTGLLIVANWSKIQGGRFEPGMTTEAAALVMFGVGALLQAGFVGPAIALGGVVAVLLHWKEQLHGWVAHLEQKDIRAIIQLTLIALVILPLLPNETYGPYDVLNPRQIWLMVVLIVGISVGAYIIYRALGARIGSVLGGIFGGLISSTATTVSYARQTKASADLVPMAALVIMIASTAVYPRVLLEISAVAPAFLRTASAPLLIMFTLMAVICVILLFATRRKPAEQPDHENPAQLKAAIVFGALYAVVIFVVAAVKEHFGESALYAVAVISGLTDMDAITLSTAQLVTGGRVSADTGWRVVLLASLSNLVFKAGAVAVLGSRRLFIHVAVLFGISLAGGLLILFLWP